MSKILKTKVAIIGAGYMSEEHIKVFSAMDNFIVSGIHSKTREKAELIAKKFKIPIVANSVSDLYEKTKADLLLIAVSELSTYSVAKMAFAHPWISIIEKPAGYNLENAILISEAAKRKKSNVFVSLNRRFYSSTCLVQDQLEKDEGKRFIQIFDQEDPFVSGKKEIIKKNWMYANSIHIIDYFKIFGRGEITSIDPIINWAPEKPELVVAKVEYSSGDIGIYTAVWNAPGPWMVSVTTEKKRWELRPLESASVQIRGSRNAESLSTHFWDDDFKPGLRNQAEEILKALNDKTHKLVSLDESLKTMQIIKEIYKV